MEAEAVKVDEALFEVLVVFAEAAAAVRAPWLMIGATARIILLERVYNWPQGLATNDVDFGVQIRDWDHYQQLCDFIIKNDIFETERTPVKRFRTKRDMVFDLVPYGGVEDDKKQVFWPPDNDDVMTVRGFDGAANNAVNVIVNESLTVPIVSPVGLCALKLFAWDERHAQHPDRDAQDIAYLLNNIESLYSSEMLFNDNLEAIEIADYHIQSAGFYQLGCDVRGLLSKEDLSFLTRMLSGEVEKNVDSELCRELHRYTKMRSIDDTYTAFDFFCTGVCQ